MVVQEHWQHAGMAGGGRKRQRKDPGSAGLGVLPAQGPGGRALGCSAGAWAGRHLYNTHIQLHNISKQLYNIYAKFQFFW
jgi:hypothetical protein